MESLDFDQQVTLNRQLHQSDPSFGINDTGLTKRLPLAIERLSRSTPISSVLDYGTGKGFLVDHLRAHLPSSITVDGFDPSVEKWSKFLRPNYDLITCIDVLEHIDIQYIDDTIRQLKQMANLFCYVTIDLQPAVKKLKDGRNAHVMLAPSEWWITRFSQYFSSITCFPIKHFNSTTQKLILTCTNDPKLIPSTSLFLNKLNLYGVVMKGGLGGVPSS